MFHRVRAFSSTSRLLVPLPIRRVAVDVPVIVDQPCIPATPQSHFQLALEHIGKRAGASACEEIWLGSSLQLKVFLRTYSMDVDYFTMKSRVVDYLALNCVDDSDAFIGFWANAYSAHKFGYNDVEFLSLILPTYRSATRFCNELFDIHMENRFNKKHFLAEWRSQKSRWDKKLLFPVAMRDGRVEYTRGGKIIKKK
ncbi:unnamed protein product [Meloidogyne enterolobii]|uniref:Uncharacterized protein n=2 Tax=Meloidogyne enterolobii TaxID=390850 RepID=A0A6V7XPI8_MELEN|nr:unnamed protein product [Meloidogyne enterolobii]